MIKNKLTADQKEIRSLKRQLKEHKERIHRFYELREEAETKARNAGHERDEIKEDYELFKSVVRALDL